MVFDRPSTRTRVSFDVAMRELGGETIMLTGAEMQLGRGETIADTARVLSRYVDAIMLRILNHADLMEMAPLRHRPCHQRSHQAVASLPGDGGHPYVRGAPRADQGAKNRLERRLQQRAVLMDRRLGAVRLHAGHRLPARIAADAPPPGRGQGGGRENHPRRRSRSRRRRAPRPSSPIAGFRWATRTKGAATTCWRLIRSTRP